MLLLALFWMTLAFLAIAHAAGQARRSAMDAPIWRRVIAGYGVLLLTPILLGVSIWWTLNFWFAFEDTMPTPPWTSVLVAVLLLVPFGLGLDASVRLRHDRARWSPLTLTLIPGVLLLALGVPA